MEDALYKIESMRYFLEHHGLGKVLFKVVNIHLEKNGLMLGEVSFVYVTINSVPSSTKNIFGKRDRIVGPLEMHQPKKGNERDFGMKMHIEVGGTPGLVHSIDTTAADVHDIAPSSNLLTVKNDGRVFGDAGYVGIQEPADEKHRQTCFG